MGSLVSILLISFDIIPSEKVSESINGHCMDLLSYESFPIYRLSRVPSSCHRKKVVPSILLSFTVK